jgi:glycosyltransferase involved in cell wall biosynthesis
MCRALQQQGIQVTLISTDAGIRVPDFKGVPGMLFPSQLGESFKYSRPLSSWLRTNIREFDLAHIHAVFNHSSVTAAHTCRKAGVPYVIRPLGTLEPWSMGQKSVRKRLFWQVAGKAMLRRAAAVHYTTEAEKLSTQRLLGLNHGKVIGLGVANGSSTACAKEKLAGHFPELVQRPYVLVLSRLHPKKGLDVLLDAFAALVQQQKFEDWRLVIAGDGPPDYVATLKQKSGKGVLFTGWLDGEAKDAVLSNATLLVLPSHQENFGLCVMEALSHSVPVLVSPHVNLAEEIVLANAGWIATVDTEALSTRLAEALADRDELTRRGGAGKELSQKYSWDNAAKSLAELYREIGHRFTRINTDQNPC